VDDVRRETGFDLAVPAEVPVTPLPSARELEIIARLDPEGQRHREVP
jgi:glutaconate CoA-transferase, subunit B